MALFDPKIKRGYWKKSPRYAGMVVDDEFEEICTFKETDEMHENQKAAVAIPELLDIYHVVDSVLHTSKDRLVLNDALYERLVLSLEKLECKHSHE